MKLPISIKLSPYDWRVISKKTTSVDGVPTDGYCDIRAREIAIAEGNTIDRKRVVLLHEIMHAAFNRAGIYKQPWATIQTEEWVCEELTPILVALLRDNPKLVKYLVS